MTTATDRAIDRSISRNQIVTIDFSTAAENDLLAECEDHVWNDDTHEFWGETCDGEQWRVHLLIGRDCVRSYRTAAGMAGDEEMVAICNRALDGEDADMAAAVEAIKTA